MSSSIMSFVEEVNEEVCMKLSKLSFKQFKMFYDVSEVNEEGKCEPILTQYKMLVEYCKLQYKNNFKLAVDYKHSGSKTDGRIFVKQTIGLQRIWNKFRGILCDGISIDLDMINAHPTILLYVCRMNNISCEILENYVNSRKLFLEQVVSTDKLTKDQAKILFICSMNSEIPITSHFVNKKEVNYKNDFYLKFDIEMKAIQNKLYELFKDDVKLIEKKTKENVKGKLLNTIMCRYENQILQEAIVRLNAIGTKVQVPMFDGCMAKITINHPINAIIGTLNTLTDQYCIKWSLKEHNTDILDKLNEMDFDDNILKFVGDNEIQVANYVLDNLLKNKLFNCAGEKFLYNKPVWTNKDVDEVLFKILSPHELCIDNGNMVKECNKSTSCLKSLINSILNLAPCKTDFYKIMHKDTKYRLFYNNGYYDFKQSKFIYYDDDNMPFTTFVIDRDFEPNNSLVDEVYKKVFYPIFNIEFDENNDIIEDVKYKQMVYTIYQLSRKLAGHIEDKTWMFFFGGRNSGKGIIERLLSNAFNPYVKSFNSSNLISKKITGEISKELAWMVDFEFSRIIFGSEIDQKLDRTGNNEIKFNGRLIKSIMSGGDELECRTNNKDARKFQIQSSIILCANDIPTCEPADAMEMMLKIDMPCRFLNDDLYKRISPGEKMSFIRKIPDNNLKDWLSNIEVQEAIEYIMIEAYKNPIVLPDEMAITLDNDDIDSDNAKLFEIYKIVEDQDGYISNDTIKSQLARNNIAISLIKASKLLVSAGASKVRYAKGRGLSKLEYLGD